MNEILASQCLPRDRDQALLIGRMWRKEVNGPSVVVVREGVMVDITAIAPTVADLLEAGTRSHLRAMRAENCSDRFCRS
jgi:fumarylacetoacetate (FAA) hydrolase family protein